MRNSKRLNLEDYLLLCDHPEKRNLFVKAQLEEVVFMHGYTRMPNLSKSVIEQDVAALELLQTPRSTINEMITPSNSYSAEELKQDLDCIGWKECHVTSVKRFGSLNSVDDSIPLAFSMTSACNSDSDITTAVRLHKKRVRRKKGGGEEGHQLVSLYSKKKVNEEGAENQEEEMRENSLEVSVYKTLTPELEGEKSWDVTSTGPAA